MGDYERVRLVTLGDAGVGKSAIVKRFLFNTFCQKYKPTVEDLYNQEYDFGPVTLKVDILDTAGDLQFPAMRRLSIATAHAFLIAYAVDSRPTFDMVKGLFEEIKEQRADFEDIPIVIAGNKIDVGLINRDVQYDEICDWLECQWPNLRVKVVDCSAKEDINIRDVFRSFLPLSKLSPVENEDSGLKRRSSAHAGSKSPAPMGPRSPGVISAGYSFFGSSSSSPPQSATPPSRGSTPTKNPSSPSFQFSQFLTEECALNPNNSTKQKQRSRSLMRRSSKKVKQQVRDVSGGPGDCQMS